MKTKKLNMFTEDNIEFISLSQFETPKFNIDSTDEYINYGNDNKLPSELERLYSSVPMHSAIIQRKVSLTRGAGLQDESGEPLSFNPNPFENWNSLIDKIITDFWTYGESYIKIGWERGGENPKEYNHVAHNSIRLGKPNELGIIENCYENKRYKDISYSWDYYTNLSQSGIEKYPMFNGKSKDKIQILHLKRYNAITQYGLPDYYSSIKDLDTLSEISTFHNANIHNNMQPGFKFIFEGAIPSKEEKDKMVKRIKDKYQSASKTGTPMIFFVPENGGMTAEPIAVSDVSKMYNLLSKDVKENVIVAHQIPSKIAGLESKGGLSSSKEVIELLELFKQSVIIPAQIQILNYLEPLLGIKLKFGIIPTNLLLSFEVSDLKEVLQQNEIRELMGYEPIEDIEETKQELSTLKRLLRW